MKKTSLPLIAAVIALALAGNALAADPVALTLNGVEEQIGSMTVHFTVTDDTGQDSTLTPEETRVTLDGRGLQVNSIEKTNYGRQPASVVLMVDVSGSMYGDPILQARAAVREFIARVEPDDRIALMTFSTGVNLLQDFTSDRSLLDAAVSNIEAFGDTALYDAVNAAVEKSNTAPPGGKLIVLLSDGVATEGVQNRAASISVAEQAGTPIVGVGLGPSVDVDYLRELTSKTGGRYVQATSSQLSATYSDIAANVVRRYFSDYTMQVTVPPTIDRTVDGTLKIDTNVRGDALVAEMPMGPLEGAIPPPYEVRISGLAPGGELTETANMGVIAPEGREIVSVEYLLDGQVLGTATDPATTQALDPGTLETGTYKFEVKTVDSKGGQGYGQLSFLVPPPAAIPPPAPEGSSFPVLPLMLLLVALGVAYLLYRVVQRRLEMAPEYVTKSLTPEPGESLARAQVEPSNRPARARAAAARAARSRYRGRIIVMRESAIMAGDLHTTREYELGEAPLTIGTGNHCDICLEDESGLIADEEARVWVQRGRITFHRLTALSAMATAGVTPGWEFFDNNDELRIGGYRFIFQVEVNEDRAQVEEEITGAPQEHGMTLRRTEPLSWDNR